MNKKSILLFFLCLILFKFSVAQLTVNSLTGAANVNIPIYSVSSGLVSLPISLSYSGSGIRPKDQEGSAGIGWQLNSGGQVSRMVRGLPDDVSKDNVGNQRLGWMSSLDTAATKIGTFTIQNNGSTCSYETADISYITTNFPFKDDTEPDIFYVNAPGLSCSVIWDRHSNSFKTINYQNVIVTFTTVGGSGTNATNIASFTITNDKGIKYVFSSTEQVTETSKAPTSGVGPYFNRKYNQYLNGITYFDSWSLTSVTDPNGNGISLNYSNYPPSTGADSVAMYIGGSTSYSLQYRTLRAVITPCVSSIATFNVNNSKTVLNFYWMTLNGSGQTRATVVDSISGCGRHFKFIYSPVVYASSGYKRSFLRSFNDPGCSTPVNYVFAYAGESVSAGTYYTVLPDSASTKRDYWEYYSNSVSSTSRMPKVWISGNLAAEPPYAIYESNTGAPDLYPYYTTNGNIRVADPSNVMTGSLNKIVYAQGGSTNIIYESNDYLDGPSGNLVQGGGVRVKQVIDSVGNGSTNNIIHNYTYLSPSTGLSSGKPASLPQFAFTIPYSGGATGNSLWNFNTVLSAYDFSGDDHTIMYQYVKVSQTGAGSTLYQYAIPGTAWDNSATPTCSGCSTPVWNPSISYIARNNCTSTYGPISNTIWSYPFIPNPNFDTERGLPVKITSYNDGGTEVSEANYTYVRTNTPYCDTAFKVDNNPSGTLVTTVYNKYPIYFGANELTATVINKVFDSPTLLVSRSDTTTYTYAGSGHRLVTKIQASNSDKSVITSNFKYAWITHLQQVQIRTLQRFIIWHRRISTFQSRVTSRSPGPAQPKPFQQV